MAFWPRRRGCVEVSEKLWQAVAESGNQSLLRPDNHTVLILP